METAKITEHEVKMEAAPKVASAQHTVQRMVGWLMRADLLTLKSAIESALSQEIIDRSDLYRIYEECMRDANLKSQWNTRKIKTLSRNWYFKKEGEKVPNDELTEMFDKPWFYAFMDKALDSIAWGFSLIEMAAWDNKKQEFTRYMSKDNYMDAVVDFPRRHVKPEKAIIVEQERDKEGKSFLTGRFSDQLIFIGSTTDLGFLVDVAAAVLIKTRTLSNWGEFAEVFGQDLLVAYTDAQGDALDKLTSSLKNLGSQPRFTADPDTTEIKTVGNPRRDAKDVYEGLADKCDGYVNKRILGQDVITNNTGQVVGEVGENVSNLYGEMDAKFMRYIVNNELIPFMEKKGITVPGKFYWDLSEKLSLDELAELYVKLTKIGYWFSLEEIEKTFGVSGGERVAPYFNRVQTEEGETEPGDPEKEGGDHGKKQPTGDPPKA